MFSTLTSSPIQRHRELHGNHRVRPFKISVAIANKPVCFNSNECQFPSILMYLITPTLWFFNQNIKKYHTERKPTFLNNALRWDLHKKTNTKTQALWLMGNSRRGGIWYISVCGRNYKPWQQLIWPQYIWTAYVWSGHSGVI